MPARAPGLVGRRLAALVPQAALLLTLLPALLLALLLSAAAAQPYAAGGGFGRPVLEQERAATAAASVAVAPSGAVTTVWAERDGVWRLDDGAEPVLLAPTDDVRTLNSAYVQDELVVTWVTRDRRTGAYHHMALVGGEARELFVDALILDIRPFDWGGEPWAAGLFRRDGEGQLRLVPLAGGEHRVVYRTDLTQRGLDLLPLPSGELWLGWLEGRNERGEFGLISEWDAQVARLPGPGAELIGPVALGEANVEDERRGVALLAHPAAGGGEGALSVLWPDEEADLRLTEVAVAGSELSVAPGGPPVGRGRPLGGSWPHLFWVDDVSVLRLDVTTLEVVSVAWSPVTIEGAAFATNRGAAEPATDALSALAWYGRAQGGAIEVYSSTDRAPFEPTFADRLAALMNWNPWHMWEEAIGQVLTALLVGVIAATAMVPAMMILAALFGRLLRSNRRALTAGLVLGAVPVVAGGILVSRGMGVTDTGPMGAWSVLLAAAVLGVLLGWLVGRSGDREPSGTLTLVGSMTTFGGASLWAFLTYKQWAPLVGLS